MNYNVVFLELRKTLDVVKHEIIKKTGNTEKWRVHFLDFKRDVPYSSVVRLIVHICL